MGHFNTRGLFNKGVSEDKDEWRKEAQEELRHFCESYQIW